MSAHAVSHENHSDSTDILGFWLYLLTDCVLFGALFAAFVVLHQPDSFGPSLKPLIDLHYVLAETMFLLFSNLSFGLAILSSYKNKKSATVNFLVLTFILGLGFVAMEINEFIHLVHEGYVWTSSAAASAFFTLVGTHGLHVSFGLLWIGVMVAQVWKMGVTRVTNRRLTYLGLFWNFLDIVWIFVFSVVYLLGAL